MPKGLKGFQKGNILGKLAIHKGQIAWNKGVPMSEETKRKMSLSRIGYKMPEETKRKIGEASIKNGNKPKPLYGDKNPAWKGDKVSYSGIHHWVKKYLGKPSKCEYCDKKEGYFEWANKSRKYLRDLTDWIQLCKPCHWKYDNQ